MATNKIRISTAITANDPNISSSNCALIWHRIVGQNIPNGATAWSFDTNNFVSYPTKIIYDYLNNNDLRDCDGLKVEVLIIPCCSMSDPDIDCSNCGSLSSLPYPNVIPDTAYHDYIDINYSILGSAVSSNGIKRYFVDSSVLSSYTKIDISGHSGCILGPDALCSGVNINITDFPTLGTPYDLNIYADNLTITGYDSSNNPTVITPDIYAYNEDLCYFNTYVYVVTNTDTSTHNVLYQDANGTMVILKVPSHDTVVFCAIEGTVFSESGSVQIVKLTRCQQ